MYCQVCGAPNRDDQEYCVRCHQKLLVLSGALRDDEDGYEETAEESFSFDEHLLERRANSRIGHASEQPGFTVVPAIGSDCFADPVVSVWLQQGLHHVFERRPDGASYIDGFIRFMSKGAQCRKAACQNAGVRIDQGAVEVQKNGAGHVPKVATGSKRVQVRLDWFLL